MHKCKCVLVKVFQTLLTRSILTAGERGKVHRFHVTGRYFLVSAHRNVGFDAQSVSKQRYHYAVIMTQLSLYFV